MLAMHLLQSCLVYVNTLMIQRVERLGAEVVAEEDRLDSLPQLAERAVRRVLPVRAREAPQAPAVGR